MVRVGGMDYVCTPNQATGSRISEMTLDNGRQSKPARATVAGWASVNPQAGKPVGEVVAAYLRAEKTVKVTRANRVKLVGVGGNPGFAEGG